MTVAQTKHGWIVLGAKGHAAGPYLDAASALRALAAGAALSCSDGGCAPAPAPPRSAPHPSRSTLNHLSNIPEPLDIPPPD